MWAWVAHPAKMGVIPGASTRHPPRTVGAERAFDGPDLGTSAVGAKGGGPGDVNGHGGAGGAAASGVAPGGIKFSGGNGGSVPLPPWTGGGGGGAAGPMVTARLGAPVVQQPTAVAVAAATVAVRLVPPRAVALMAAPAAMATPRRVAAREIQGQVPATGPPGQAVVAGAEDIRPQIMAEAVPAVENSMRATAQVAVEEVGAGTTAPSQVTAARVPFTAAAAVIRRAVPPGAWVEPARMGSL
jgi:hypothetical protein